MCAHDLRMCSNLIHKVDIRTLKRYLHECKLFGRVKESKLLLSQLQVK